MGFTLPYSLLASIIAMATTQSIFPCLYKYRYNHRELDSAKTWIEEDDGPHDFTELTVIGGSQLACMSAGNLTSPVKTTVEHLHGDTTGRMLNSCNISTKFQQNYKRG